MTDDKSPNICVETESGLVSYARRELQLAGLFDKDSDYNGDVGHAVMDIVKTFSTQGHSGFSAGMVTLILEKLLRYEPLTPITDNPSEWNDVSEHSVEPMWQSQRSPATFSKDGGKTWYNLDDAEPDVV